VAYRRRSEKPTPEGPTVSTSRSSAAVAGSWSAQTGSHATQPLPFKRILQNPRKCAAYVDETSQGALITRRRGAEQVASDPHIRVRYFCSLQHANSTLFPIIAHLERAAGLDRSEAPTDKVAKVETILRRSGAEEWPADDVGLICELLSIPIEGRYRSELSPRKRKERLLTLLLRLIEMSSKKRVKDRPLPLDP
jgi:hypothetical protein